LSGQGKKQTERGALTLWRQQREGLVRTRKETDQARGTHVLETAERATCQDTKRNYPNEGHSLPGDGRARDLSGHEKKPTDRGALTSWRRQREGLVKKRKGMDRVRGTHSLETVEGGTRQDTERNGLSEGHSLPGDSKARDLSGHGNKPTEQGALTLWRWQRRDLSGHEMRPTEQGALTYWRRQSEGLVRTRKETDRARGTHFLETTEGGTCQDTERNRQSDAHSQTGDSRGRDLSEYGKKPTERGELTPWRWQREGFLRTCKEINRVRGTHFLEKAEGGTCQDTERNRPSKGHSLPGDDRGSDLSA
jgi:hypothetical protein